jgi:hypothetical protein
VKIKLMQSRKSGSQTLQIKPGKNEKLQYEQAEWLVSGPSEHLLPFRYTLEEGDAVLYYDITGLSDLKSYLRASLNTSQYAGMLVAVADVLGTCTSKNYPTSGFLCDIEQVYVNPDGVLKFVFVPLSGMAPKKNETPLGLLGNLGDTKHVSFVVPDDARHAAALFDYVNRNQVLSLNSYREFLSGEFGLALPSLGGSHGGSGRLSRTGSLAGSGSLGSGGSGSLGARCGSGTGTMAGTSFSSQNGRPGVQAAFDPVAMLHNAPSAHEVAAKQSIAERVRNGVGDISPTRASATTGFSQPKQHEGQEQAGESQQVEPQKVESQKAEEPLRSDEPQQVEESPQQEELQPEEQQLEEQPQSEELQPKPQPAQQLGQQPEPQSAAVEPEPTFQSEVPPQPQPPFGMEPPQQQTSDSAQQEPSFSETTLLGVGVNSQRLSTQFAKSAPEVNLVRLCDGSMYQLPKDGAAVIGRSSKSDIQIRGNSNISRTHASLTLSGGSVVVVDLGSSNGTFVNGVRLYKGQMMTARPGDEISFADEAFELTLR